MHCQGTNATVTELQHDSSETALESFGVFLPPEAPHRVVWAATSGDAQSLVVALTSAPTLLFGFGRCEHFDRQRYYVLRLEPHTVR
jgi:hypothetical protein